MVLDIKNPTLCRRSAMTDLDYWEARWESLDDKKRIATDLFAIDDIIKNMQRYIKFVAEGLTDRRMTKYWNEVAKAAHDVSNACMLFITSPKITLKSMAVYHNSIIALRAILIDIQNYFPRAAPALLVCVQRAYDASSDLRRKMELWPM
jgi:hypothetical protein